MSTIANLNSALPMDTRGRGLRDLRISVTDRCNFRCVYCMPKSVFGAAYKFLDRKELLTFEEIERVARAFVANGVVKLRLTGGEPLVRRQIEELIERLANIEGVEDLSLTTNAALLTPQRATALIAAGLSRITVSLDSLDDVTFKRVNDVNFPVEKVLNGINNAADAGLGPVKVNMVVKRGMNEDGIVDMAAKFRGTPHILRFIEFMDVGTTNGWRLADVICSKQIAAIINASTPLNLWIPTIVVKSPNAGVTLMAAARLALFLGHSRSAAAARGRDCPRKARFTPACLHPKATISGHSCVMVLTTQPWLPPLRNSGACATTVIRKSVPSRRSA